MTHEQRLDHLGFVGGTGPQGRGLACRWAKAGHQVTIGSRSVEKAQEAVDDVAGRLGAGDGSYGILTAATNLDAATVADLVVVSVPFDAQAKVLPDLRAATAGKVVLSVVNPMVFDDLGPKAVRVAAGSAAEECQELLPDAIVVSAFHDVSSRRLLRPDEAIETDVLICGDDQDATHRVAHLAARIEGMWGVYGGPLRNSEYIENITPVLLFINRYYRIQAGLLIDGIERDDAAMHAHRAEGEARGGRKGGAA